MTSTRSTTRFGWAAAAIAALLVMLASSAGADCALIPVNAIEYGSPPPDPSISTLVRQPFASPGDPVTVRANLACVDQPGFDPDPANNVVSLRFVPLTGVVVAPVIVDSSLVSPGNCGSGVQSSGQRCDTLTFILPFVPLPAPNEALSHTGPVEIRVEDPAGDLLAFIGPLLLPTSACDAAEQSAEQLFQHFTALPTPNLFDGVVTSVQAALDGGGNLLIPFDWSPALEPVDGALARVVQGSARLQDGSGQLISIPDSDFNWFRSFEARSGRPIPPLLEELTGADGTIQVFGTIDAPRSVLRLARMGPDTQSPPQEVTIFDLSAAMFGGVGPVVIADGLELRALEVVPLNSLNTSGQVVAVAADEESLASVDENPPFPAPGDRNGDGDTQDKVPIVVQLATGLQTNTGSAVVEIGDLPKPVLAAGGEGNPFAAFFESEAGQGGSDQNGDSDTDDAFFKAFAATGAQLTGGSPRLADIRPFVGAKPLVISKDFAFFRSFEADGEPGDEEVVWETGQIQGTVTRSGIFGSDVWASFSFDPSVLAGVDYSSATPAQDLGSFEGSMAHDPLMLDGSLQGTFSAPGSAPAFSAPSPLGIFYFDRKRPLRVGAIATARGRFDPITADPALPSDFDELAYRITRLEVTEILEKGNHGFIESYDFEGEFEFLAHRPAAPDLNADGDGMDSVLNVFASTDPGFRPKAEVVASTGAVADGRIAFATSENLQDGFIGNDDGDSEDDVAQMYDANTDVLLNLGVAASAVAISPSVICLIVPEEAEGPGGSFLNGDSDKLDTVLHYWRIGDPLPPVNAGIAADAVDVVADTCVFTVPEDAEGDGGSILNGDGDAVDRVLHLLDSLSGDITNVGQAAADFVVGSPLTTGGVTVFHLVAYRTCEQDQNDAVFPGNGDDDDADCVLQIRKIPGPADAGNVPVDINTRIAADLCNIDGCDPFFAPYVAVGPTVSALGPEPIGFGVNERGVTCLPTSPAGVCDYTGDGTGTEDVIHVFNAISGKTQVYPVVAGSGSDLPPFFQSVLGDNYLIVCAPETFFGVDVDGDGEISPDVICAIMDDADDDFTLDSDVVGTSDSCQETQNADQTDVDGDGRGDGVCDPDPTTEAEPICDVDRDCDIDSDDLLQILLDRGRGASPGDPADADGDGTVTIGDWAICDGLIGPVDSAECSEPEPVAATTSSAGGSGDGCGLGGFEMFFVLAAVGAIRRARRARFARSKER